ncbi:MAG TPA: hypothetical protein VML55_21100 [Planctomycetaceae bacterium]|nr:hypothetical protein [Planctomycetaceae bacterium]
MRKTPTQLRKPAAAWPLALLVPALLAGCGGPGGPHRKETFPVVGQVVVDGQPPASPVKVRLHDLQGMGGEHPTVSHAMTGDDGRFEISTYESGDGAPAGDYVLTFEWGRMNLMSMQYGGPDKLGGRYADPQKSKIRFSVTPDDGAVDLGRIELTTK